MQALDSDVVVELPELGGELCRMRLDRAAQACIVPTDSAIALPRQATSQRLEQHRVCSVSMYEDDSFLCHGRRLARHCGSSNCVDGSRRRAARLTGIIWHSKKD